MTLRLPIRSLLLVLMTGIMLAGCSSDDDEGEDTPTSAPPTQAASTATGEPTTAATPDSGGTGATTVPATFAAGSGQIVTDGICQATIPDDWVDTGTGSGSTASGARYALFGNIIRTDDAWNQAVKLVKDAAAKIEGANVSEGETFVRVDNPDNKGFEYRGRFADRYCDFSVTSTSSVPEDERAIWDAIIGSMGPVTA
jgi:hypothetical protein